MSTSAGTPSALAVNGRVRLVAALLSAGLAAYFSLWIFQGVDMTDEGYHLTNQLMFAEGRTENPAGMLWLTYGIGGLWLRLFDGGLLAARAAWVLTLSLTGLVTFLILARRARPMPAALATAAGAVACTHHGNMVVNQNNLPFLLLLSGAGLLLAAEEGGAPRRRRWLALGSGAALGLAVMARFPLVIGLGLVFVPPAVRRIHLGRARPGAWANAGWALLGALAAVGAALAGLGGAGRLPVYLQSLAGSGFKEEYAAGGLLAVYGQSALYALRALAELLVQAVPWAIGLHVLCRWLRCGRWAPALLGVVGLGWIAATARSAGFAALHWEYFHLLPALCMLAALAAFAAGWRRGTRDEEGVRTQILLAVAAALPVLIMAGTNNGIINMTHGLWLVFPAAALLVPSAAASLAATEDGGRRAGSAAAAYTVSIVAVLAVTSASIRCVNPYRDARARWRLTAPAAVPRLHGILTTPRRAASLRELFDELSRRARPGDGVLACRGLPLVHFVTRTVPALDNPWPECMGVAELKHRLAVMRERGPRPVVVVRAVTDMSSGKWGGDPAVRPAISGLDRVRAEAVDGAVRGMGYRAVWTNVDFVILAPPVSGGEGAAPAEASGTSTRTPSG
jgi:hypothetical protein